MLLWHMHWHISHHQHRMQATNFEWQLSPSQTQIEKRFLHNVIESHISDKYFIVICPQVNYFINKSLHSLNSCHLETGHELSITCFLQVHLKCQRVFPATSPWKELTQFTTILRSISACHSVLPKRFPFSRSPVACLQTSRKLKGQAPAMLCTSMFGQTQQFTWCNRQMWLIWATTAMWLLDRDWKPPMLIFTN